MVSHLLKREEEIGTMLISTTMAAWMNSQIGGNSALATAYIARRPSWSKQNTAGWLLRKERRSLWLRPHSGN